MAEGPRRFGFDHVGRSEEHTSELQSQSNLVCRLLLEKKQHQFWPSEEAMAECNPQLILERGEPSDKPPALIIHDTSDHTPTLYLTTTFTTAHPHTHRL